MYVGQREGVAVLMYCTLCRGERLWQGFSLCFLSYFLSNWLSCTHCFGDRGTPPLQSFLFDPPHGHPPSPLEFNTGGSEGSSSQCFIQLAWCQVITFFSHKDSTVRPLSSRVSLSLRGVVTLARWRWISFAEQQEIHRTTGNGSKWENGFIHNFWHFDKTHEKTRTACAT